MIKFRKILRRPRHEWYSQQTMTDRRRRITELFLLLIALALLNILGLLVFDDFSPWDALWTTMTTMTTVGYGDLSPGSWPAQLMTMVFMYGMGIFVLAQIAGEWIDFRMDRRERMRRGLWRWDMQDHIVILNTPDNPVRGARYLQGLVEQVRATTSLEPHPIQIFSSAFADGLPPELASLGVVLHHGRPEGRRTLAEVDVASAAYILVMAVDSDDFRSDSITLDILDQLKRYELTGYVIAECVQDDNRQRLRDHGADAVIRPVRAYPELMVRAMAAPGTEEIMENLFQHQGTHPMRYNIVFSHERWGVVATNILMKGLGTALGYVDETGDVITNPPAEADVSGTGLFVLVDHESVPTEASIRRCLSLAEQAHADQSPDAA